MKDKSLFNLTLHIDFLRLPRPQGLPAGRQGSEEPTTQSGGARRSQNQFTPPGDGVNKLIFKLLGLSHYINMVLNI
jgi:hypothetical protein